jgi:hypothetical protein
MLLCLGSMVAAFQRLKILLGAIVITRMWNG